MDVSEPRVTTPWHAREMDMEAGMTWIDGDLLGFDLETTGVDRFSDRPVSFALVRVAGGAVRDCLAGLVDPGMAIPVGATAVHGISTERARAEGQPLDRAVTVMVDELVKASNSGIPVVGMKLDFDLTILDIQCRRVDGRGLATRGFSGAGIDALVLDRHVDRYRRGRRRLGDLCSHYGVSIDHAHDARADAEASVLVVTEIIRRHPELALMELEDLHRSEIQWHREWAESFDQWRREHGQDPLDPGEFEWPVPGGLNVSVT